ncbi:MAG: hypothetical protein ACI8XB_002323 [Patiriisocius sp.]|jgi:hypothetical protein
MAFLKNVSNLFPLSFLIKGREINTFLPFYHGVYDDVQDPMIKHLYPMKSLKDFTRDLDVLLENFAPISLLDLMNGKTVGDKPCFHLTFDDGLSSCYNLIMPILLEKKIPATFFLNSDFIDNKGLFYRYKVSLIIEHIEGNNQNLVSKSKEILKAKNLSDIKSKLLSFGYNDVAKIDDLALKLGLDFSVFLEKEKPYLSSDQIKEMIANGFTFGSHSCDHPYYNKINLEEQIRQTIESTNFVKRKFNLNYSTFAFPFTDDGVEANFFEKIESEKLLNVSFGTAGLKKTPYNFHNQRTPMEDLNISGLSRIKMEYFKKMIKIIIGRN